MNPRINIWGGTWLSAWPILLVLALSLAACSGGSSSGSKRDSGLAGTYEGGGDTAFAIGQTSLNDYVPTKLIIHSQGDVTVTDGSANIRTSGSIDGDRFESSGNFSFSTSGMTCDLSIVYVGLIRSENGTAVASGTVSGSGECNGEPASVNGTYTASIISDVTRSPVNSGFEQKFTSLKQK